jgi:hypothetical protein
MKSKESKREGRQIRKEKALTLRRCGRKIERIPEERRWQWQLVLDVRSSRSWNNFDLPLISNKLKKSIRVGITAASTMTL